MGLWPRPEKAGAQDYAPDPEAVGDECREAFLRLCAERDAIDLSAPGNRQGNGKRWLAKHTAINDVLDQFNEWVRLR